MPELPEVETVMRGMAVRLEGRRILRAELRRADLRVPIPPGLAARLSGTRVLGFRRRAKYILMRLEGGDSMLLHLGMSGRIVLRRQGSNEAPPAHEHLWLLTEDGWEVGLVDPRRFGLLDLMPSAAEDAHRLLADLGPEPFDPALSPARFAASLAGRASPIKAVLLDQRVIAGLGNIYVAEALFAAGISPRRLAGSVGAARAGRLLGAVRTTLERAIAAGGSSLRDYVQPDGELGYFQHAWAVYGREGEKCPACPGPPGCAGVKRFTQAGRSTFYCPKTQR